MTNFVERVSSVCHGHYAAGFASSNPLDHLPSKMIRTAKSNGWLHQPPSHFIPWARLNGISFDGVRPEEIAPPSVDGQPSPSKGFGLVAARDLEPAETRLTAVPRESGLVLGREGVVEMGKADARLAELLEACREFATVCQPSLELSC